MADEDYPPGSFGAEKQRLAAEIRALLGDEVADAYLTAWRASQNQHLAAALDASEMPDLAAIVRGEEHPNA